MSDQYQRAVRLKAFIAQTQDMFDDYGQELLKQIGETRPEETVKRESLYHQFNALRDVQAALVAKASHADIEDHRNSLAEAGFSR